MMRVDILSPDKTIFQGEADSLVLPGKDGSFGVLEDHAPMIATLGPGKVKITNDGADQFFELNGGVVEVVKNRVIVLAE